MIYLFIIKAFMLDITIQLDISSRLTLKITTIICHHIKKIVLKKQKYGKTIPKLMLTKMIHKYTILIHK